MKNLLILGAGSGGTMMANHLVKKLDSKQWKITVVDQEKTHYYQPGFLFVPFGIYKGEDIVKPIGQYIPKGVQLINKKIDRIDKDSDTVYLEGETFKYDILIIATGSHIAPDEIEGMLGDQWQKSIFDFYSFEGSVSLANKLKDFKEGKLVVHICEMPIKCPVAPLEFAFLADDYFTKKGLREKVEITYVTPMSGAFTKPKATEKLHYLLEQKKINVVPNFNIEKVDSEANKIVSYEGKEVDYNLLVTVPTNMGDKSIERSGFGDELNYVPTDKHTLQSKVKENIFVIGDATNVPASKAGSVAHFESELLTENILNFINGKELQPSFDGHSNCFIETGKGKALLIDFNYEVEPVEGTFPIPGIGPMRLLKENRMNHIGKKAFKWVYWNMLLKGRKIPFVGAQMNKKGKKIDL